MQLHHRFLVATAIAFSLATGELDLRASEVEGAVRIGWGLSSTGDAKSPMELAAALERRIVSGEGVALPDADVPVILDAGAVDISLGSWPDEFFSFATSVGADLRAARPWSAGFQPADTARPEAVPPSTGTLFVLSPSLAPFCGHHCGETIYLSADGFPVDHSYPFEETCLRKAFLRDDTGAPHCGGTISLGLRGDAQSALDTGSFSGGTAFNGAITTSVEVSDEHITGRVHVGGAFFWFLPDRKDAAMRAGRAEGKLQFAWCWRRGVDAAPVAVRA